MAALDSQIVLSTFVGGLAGGLAALTGIVGVEWWRESRARVRDRAAQLRGERDKRAEERAAAKSVLVELHSNGLPFRRLLEGEGFFGQCDAQHAWASSREILSRRMTVEALLDVQRAYRDPCGGSQEPGGDVRRDAAK